MPGPVDHLDTVGEVVEELRGLGLPPVLVAPGDAEDIAFLEPRRKHSR